jgi:hypothetical protein
MPTYRGSVLRKYQKGWSPEGFELASAGVRKSLRPLRYSIEFDLIGCLTLYLDYMAVNLTNLKLKSVSWSGARKNGVGKRGNARWRGCPRASEAALGELGGG